MDRMMGVGGKKHYWFKANGPLKWECHIKLEERRKNSKNIKNWPD